jgi:cytochrome P450
MARTATADVELGGRRIPQGEKLLLLYPSANRDEAVFGPTAPDFDIRRDPNPHVAFGFGTHFCLGASLARLEGRVALDEMLNRWPEWDVDYDGIELSPTSTVRGWESMPIVVG